jgi:hypothetical protein
MIQDDPVRKVPFDQSEMAYLLRKKDEDVARQMKMLGILIVFVAIISVFAGIVLAIVVKVSPQIFWNSGMVPPAVLPSALMLFVALSAISVIGSVYSYARTVRKLIKDIRVGKKAEEPCLIIRKFHAVENDTYHVYITSNVRLSIELTAEEYALLAEGDKIYIEYSPLSKIFFGYGLTPQ